ncbi:hypothetical protein [Pseudomonas putida]|uniref:hypothetical protein n=1 Tax=Pseudomonas putida TaxID=303 RepID=UPI003D96C202
MLDAAMTVHEQWLGNLRRGWRISLVTGHLQPVRDRALQACGSKVFLCFELIVYKTCMHLSEICASPESMEFAADFVWLSTGAKSLKIGGYNLTDRAGIYFWGRMQKGMAGREM